VANDGDGDSVVVAVVVGGGGGGGGGGGKAASAGDATNTVTGAAAPARRLHKIKSNVITAKPERTLSLGGGGGDTSVAVVVKQWQRLPKQLLQEHCDRQKAPKPEYYTQQRAGGGEQHFCRVRLPDSKNKEKDQHFK